MGKGRLRSTWGVAMALLLAGCAHMTAPAAAQLDELLAFAEPATCEPAADHARLLAALVAGDANDGFRPGEVAAPPALVGAFGRVYARRHEGYWTVGAPVHGLLFGLPLIEIVHALPEGGDAGDVTYVFGAPVGSVEASLRRRGFPVRAGSDVPVGSVDAQQLGIGLRADPANPGRTLLTCGVL